MNEIVELVEISKYAGERFDLVQAGGGNSSVKFDNGKMAIKASGFLLSEVEENSGYSLVDSKQIANIIENNQIFFSKDKKERDLLASRYVNDAIIDKEKRPSIETLLHSVLLKYTLHTHPVVVNMIVSQKNWNELLYKIFQNKEIALVKYRTPGIELAIELYSEIKKFKKIPNIIFLQNHGLIVTSDNISDIKILTEYVLDKIVNFLNIDMSKYKLTNKITSMCNKIKQTTLVSYLCEDTFLNKMVQIDRNIFFNRPFSPDTLVYCGARAVEINNFDDFFSINEYKNKYYDLPRIIIYKKYIFIRAQNIKKAKEIEDVLRFHIMVLANMPESIQVLNTDELLYLSNLDSEKYRLER